MAKLVTNNNKSAFIKLLLFFAIKILDSCMNYDIVELTNASTYEQIFKQKL